MSKKYQERLARSSGFSSKQFKSDFGLKVLKKFGWEEGKGLGKNEDGREECIQQRRRDGNAGLGTEKKAGPEGQWENWWCDVFNTTAKRLASKATESTRDDDAESSDSEAEDETTKRSSEGGRTSAIKSASRMAGKLKRVLRQEGAAAATPKTTLKTTSKAEAEEADASDGSSSKKRKREKKRSESEAEASENCEEDEEERKRQRKAEKKRLRLLQEEQTKSSLAPARVAVAAAA